MSSALDHSNLHRTAKYFMDSGRSDSHDAAVDLLKSFGLTIYVDDESARSPLHQTALLTLVNVARRTLLGGIEVIGACDVPSRCLLAPNQSLADAVRTLGGRTVAEARIGWPAALIGSATPADTTAPCWQVTWQGWSGGVIPFRDRRRLDESSAISLAPVLAAAVCASEAFAYHAGDHPLAGRRSAGLSLWNPSHDWQSADSEAPELAYLPSRLWLIGMGNLGQAFAWLLACLPYRDRKKTEFVLHDFDRIAPSNDSTSVLSFLGDVGRRKTRCVAAWLEERGFTATLEERRFGEHTRRTPGEPGVALCGVDNALGRMSLEKAGFDLVVEAGLGGGPNAFRSISLHTFPSTSSAEQIWSRYVGQADGSFEGMPAYRALKDKGVDSCGLAQLASRTVGVPFVGVVAGSLVMGELLRRLHGGRAYEVVSGSMATPSDFKVIDFPATPYPGAYEPAAVQVTSLADSSRIGPASVHRDGASATSHVAGNSPA